MKTLIVGDSHGLFLPLLGLIAEQEPDLVLQCGDFGYWPKRPVAGWDASGGPGIHGAVLQFAVPVHWCDGNHENHHALSNLRDGDPAPRAHQVGHNCFWQDRGSTLTLPDRRVVLFVGGADSIDKATRREGFDWFPEEVLTSDVLPRLPDCKVDIVVSHTAPLYFHLSTFGPMLGPGGKNRDPSRVVLNRVFDRYRPSQWFFSHWHYFRSGEHENCKWTMLNMVLPPELDVPPDKGSWWRWL